MPTNAEREERAIWKLEQAGYRVQRQPGGYRVTSAERTDELATLAELAEYAEAVYERVWVGRRITPSA